MWWIGVLAWIAVGCGDDSGPLAPDGGGACTMDDDCSDGRYCNGVEVCDPSSSTADARGCAIAASPCLENQSCVESDDACVTLCELTDDADGDGVTAIECGGSDCDDRDRARYPGGLEVCDGRGHDEDCVEDTYGDRDIDGDGHDSTACYNTRADGTEVRGDDCDDTRSIVQPDASESCDVLDNDCDGTIDEGVTVAGFYDRDADGDGDPASPRASCPGAVQFSVTSGDCDDTDLSRSSLQVEVCDAEDNDCDDTVDENPRAVPWYRDEDGDLYGRGSREPGAVVVSCLPVPGYSLVPSDCDDMRMAVSPARTEVCNGIDDDCNGLLDYVIAPGDLEDDDRDGTADSVCPLGGTDCDDDDAFASNAEGYLELCEDLVDNDCDGTIDEEAPPPIWHADLDGDGYTDGAGTPITDCHAQPGYSYLSGDCDDSTAERRPLAFDRCDLVDQDCDGRVDEAAGLRAYYADSDGDGAGSESEVVFSCAPIPGYAAYPRDCDPDDAGVALRYVDRDLDGYGDATPLVMCTGAAAEIAIGGDCADGDAAVFPGAAELCNGRDDDCNGEIDETGAGGCPEGSSWRCEAGACVFVACSPGYTDCDAEPGCETDPMTSTMYCGGCLGEICGAGADCTDGACVDDILDVSASLNRTCVRRANGRIVCWGNPVGGDEVTTAGVVLAEGTDTFSAGAYSLCVVAGGVASCTQDRIGSPSLAIGVGRPTGLALTPLTPMATPDLIAIDLSFNGSYGCGRRASGEAYCWGTGANGNLGTGMLDDEPSPARVFGLTDVVDIDAGYQTTCAALATGQAMCWGNDGYGQLGDGAAGGGRDSPHAVDLLDTDSDPVVDVGAGLTISCARRRSGVVQCWGYAQDAGVAATTAYTGPARVVTASGPLPPVVELEVGELHACARTDGGDVYCWGRSDDGRLGNDMAPDMERAVAVTGMNDAIAIGLGDSHSCAVRADRSVWCWGNAASSVLGGPGVDQEVPARVIGLP